MRPELSIEPPNLANLWFVNVFSDSSIKSGSWTDSKTWFSPMMLSEPINSS